MPIATMSRRSVEDFVTEISTRLIGLPPDNVDGVLDATLGAVGALAGCDRVYLFVVEGQVVRNTHEWCAAGVDPQIDHLQAVPVRELPRMIARLRRGEFVRVDRVEDVEALTSGERAHLRAQGVRSLAVAPINPGGRLAGFLGVDAVGREVAWSDQVVTVLRWLADVLGGVLVRREGHQALLRSEARYRAVVEQQTDLVCRYRPDTTLTFVNPAFARAVGLPADDLVGRSLFSFIPAAERGSVFRPLACLAAGQAVETYEHPVRLGDGSVRSYQWQGRPITGSAGEVAEIQAVGRDVTDRREAETALRESEERFRGAFEDAPIGMAIAAFDGRFVRVNRALCALLGYTEPELLARTLSAVTSPAGDGHRSDVERLLSGEATSVLTETRYVRADGSRLWGLVTVSLIRGSRGKSGQVLVQVVDITDRKIAEEQLAQLALHDPLTGLPNRVLLLDRLGQALARAHRNGTGVAALFCNLDHFKVVNDSLGHAGGDELLVKLAGRLRRHARAEETVARFGADEFVVVLEGVNRQRDAVRFARRLGRTLESPLSVLGSEVVPSMSIGIAVAGAGCAPGAVAADTLVRDASAAMSRAKRLGGGRVVICDDATAATTAGRLELLNALRDAVPRGELRLHYQPIFRCGNGEVVGAEALVRWNHPQRGLLGPSDFLPLAEQTGLVSRIGTWVLDEACREAAGWRREPGRPPPQLWVNVSAAELARPNLAEIVASSLRAAGAEPTQLCLELTEHAVMADPDQAIATLTALRALGVRVAIDDFGTGYSSMASLSQLPLDALKIDRSFVTGMATRVEDVAITRAIIDLAHGLGLEVVAEGVEDEQQLAELRSLGCDLVQGYLLAPPRPGAELAADPFQG